MHGLCFYLSIQSDALVLNKQRNNLNFSHLAETPAQLNLIHAPQFVDVLSQLVPNPLQMRWHDNLRTLRAFINMFVLCITVRC